MSGDIYKIGISLMVGGNANQFFAGLSRQILGAHTHAHDLEKRLHSVNRTLALGGGIAIAGGLSILTGLKHVSDHARELTHEMTQLKKLNVGDAGLAEVAKKARDVTDAIKGVKEVDALKAYGSTFSIFGHQDALKLMGPISQFAQVAGNTSDNYERASSSVYEMIRAGDLFGKFVDHTTHAVDIDKLKHFLDLGAKVTLGTHGKVEAKTWLGLAQQGGPAMSGMTDRGLLTMAIAAQAMGGPRAGTALTSLYQQLVGGKMTDSVYGALYNLDLAGGKVTTDAKGKKHYTRTGVSEELKEALKLDPIDAVKIIKRQMEKKGITDIEKQVPVLFDILGRQTTQRIVHDLLRNMPQILSERERIAGSMGLDQSKAVQDSEDYEQAEHNLRAAYENLMTDLAGPNAGTAIGVMSKLTDGLRYLTGVVRGIDPETLKRIGLGLGAIGIALTTGGAVALLAALGPVGWLTAGVVGLVATLGAFHADGVRSALHRLSMFFALAKSEALIIYGHLKGLALDPKNMDMIRSTLGTTGAEFEMLKTGLGKALEWYQVVLGWRQKAQDAIMSFLGGFGGGMGVDHPGMSESARQGLADRKVDPMGKFVTDLITMLNNLDQGLFTASQALANEIKSWPGRLLEAIKDMGAGIVTAIGSMFRSIFDKLNIFSKTSLEGTGLDRSMIHNASWTGLDGAGSFNGKALGIGAGSGIGHAASKEERAAYIRAAALARGMDPETALRVSQSEGFNKYVGDYGTSFGDWQLHFGGSGIRGMNSGGLGDVLRRNGINAKDPNTWKQQTDFALDWAKKHGWGDWHGAKRAGIGNWRGINAGKPRDEGSSASQPATSSPNSSKSRELVVHLHTHLDGRKIAMNTARHMFNEGNGPATGANFADGSEAYPQIG